MPKHTTFWDRFWKDKQGKVVIAQAPNVLQWAWLGCGLMSVVIRRGAFHEIFSTSGTVLLAIWALYEIASGVNYFRRLLGLVVLAAIIINRI